MPQLGNSNTTKLYLPSTKDEPEEADRLVVEMRSELLLGDIAEINTGSDETAKAIGLVTKLMSSWNANASDGSRLPITQENVEQMRLEDFAYLSTWMSENVAANTEGLSDSEKKTSSSTSIPVTDNSIT